MQKHPSIVTISGEHQNVGKTLFACALIQRFGADFPLIGLKISSHHHKNTANAWRIASNAHFDLYLETDLKSEKDTSRMLMSGAQKAFLLQTTDSALNDGMQAFWKEVGKESLVICESQRINRLLQPGLSFFIRTPGDPDKERAKKADTPVNAVFVTQADNKFDFDFKKLLIFENQWRIKE